MSNELAKPSFDDSLRNHLAKNKAKFISALDGQIEFERFAVVVMNAIRRTPALAECSVSSVVEAVTKCAELGLEPNGPLQHAALVPFKGECKLVVMYRGQLHLMFRSGGLKDATAHVVYEGDKFSGQLGTNPSVEHPISFTKRGKPIGAYAVINYANGGQHIEAMNLEEIEKVRASSRASKGPWFDWWDEMARKTVLKRGAKYAPAGANLQLLAKAAEYDDDVIDSTATATPAPSLTAENGGQTIDATAKVKAAVGEMTDAEKAEAVRLETEQAKEGA